MRKRVSKSGVVSSLVTLIVVLVIFNVCTFVIPFNKMDLTVHYIIYGCAEFVIIAQMVLIITQLFLEGKPNQKIMGLPILCFGYVTLLIQLLFTLILYIINAFIVLPIWIVIILECLIIGLGIVQVSLGFFFKKRNDEYQESVANTKFMDEFRGKVKAIYQSNKDSNLGKELEDLLDIALGSDPLTNERTIQIENKMSLLFKELENKIANGSDEESYFAIEQLRNTLIERNILCKTGK